MAGYKQVYGKTWDVYLCILTSDAPIGVRDIWRTLKLSSPSLAQYHVNKLMELKLVETTPGGKYITNDEERLEALRSFLSLRGMLIPRMVVYAALLSGVLFTYVAIWPWWGDYRDLTVLGVTMFSILAFLFEAVKQYRGLSTWKRET
jgi:hypothetical protein